MIRNATSFFLAAVISLSTSTAAAQGRALPEEPEFSSPEAAAQYHVLVGELAAHREQPETAVREFLRALEFVPDADLANRATRLALIARNEPLALEAARRWQNLDPSDLTAREAVARLALRAGHHKEAMAQCEGIITGHAGGPAEGFREVALLLSQESSRREDALEVMEQLRRKWPDLAAAHYAQSLLALRFDDLDLAEHAARTSLQLDAKSPDALLLLTGVLIRKGNLEHAEQVFADLLKVSEDEVETRLGYARLLLEAEHAEAATRQFDAILAAEPEHNDARYALGLLALEQRDLDRAEPHFRKLLAEPVMKQQAAYYLGRIEEIRNRPQEALEWYRQVTQGDQGIDAIIRQALLLGELGDVQEGRSLLGRVRQQLPTMSTRFYLAEGELLLNADAGEQALALYQSALAESPQDDDLLYGRSLVHERLSNLEQAEADLREILKRDPDDARSLNALGYMLTVHTDRLEEAHRLIVRALELTPDDAAVIDSMGWIEYRMGNADEALPLLEKAFEKAKDPEIAAHLGEVLWKLGDRDRARSIWEEALESDPDHRVLRETVNRFSE